MSENEDGSDPPPQNAKSIQNEKGYQEPEDWDMPPRGSSLLSKEKGEESEEECPEILEDIEPEEAIGTIFTNMSPPTIISICAGIILMILFYAVPALKNNPLLHMVLGFVAGLTIVFGSSELILLGVKGISDKLNWNPYFGGIISAVGAALNELVVVIILLFRSKGSTHGTLLATTAITLILTTVLINTFFLGLSMIFVARDGPFSLPKELTFVEANLVLGMMVFSFIIMIYGFAEEFIGIKDLISEEIVITTTFSRIFEIVIGMSLVLIYFIFLYFLAKNLGRKTSTPQTLISEFFPNDDEICMEEPPPGRKEFPLKILIPKRIADSNPNPSLPYPISSNLPVGEDYTDTKKTKRQNGYKTKQERSDALATLRRFPWIIIIVIFILGLAGIIQGGNILAASIESGIEIFPNVTILVYSVVVGLISSSPELIVTFRGLVSGEKELVEVGLVHQVSAINQTFFILFGVPFIISGIFAIGIPIAIEITLVMGGIFVLSIAVLIMIMDDNKFDLLEGAVITIISIVSLLALAMIETGTNAEGENMLVSAISITKSIF
ncbi:MAG: hypothetical protein GF308_05240 [Candidatus Heimdallarchaeota archaeon]|nr:hypothetical protein [Candidatus Heimdallarchaeota archaeon]